MGPSGVSNPGDEVIKQYRESCFAAIARQQTLRGDTNGASETITRITNSFMKGSLQKKIDNQMMLHNLLQLAAGQ